MMDDAENDVLAFMDFPKAHRKQIASTNPLERVNVEIKRRTANPKPISKVRISYAHCRLHGNVLNRYYRST